MWTLYRFILLILLGGVIPIWMPGSAEHSEKTKPISLVLLRKNTWYVFETSQPIYSSVKRGILTLYPFSGTEGTVKVVGTRTFHFLPDPKGGSIRYYDPFHKREFNLSYLISTQFDPISCSSRDRLGKGNMHFRLKRSYAAPKSSL